MEGIGVYKFNNGIVYKGEFSNNIINGKGQFKWTNGNIFEGDIVIIIINNYIIILLF